MQCTKYFCTLDTQEKVVLPAFFLVGWSNIVNSGQWLKSRSNIYNFWASAFNCQEKTLEPSFLLWWFQLLRWWPGSLSDSVEQSPLATCDGWATGLGNPCFGHWNFGIVYYCSITYLILPNVFRSTLHDSYLRTGSQANEGLARHKGQT